MYKSCLSQEIINLVLSHQGEIVVVSSYLEEGIVTLIGKRNCLICCECVFVD